MHDMTRGHLAYRNQLVSGRTRVLCPMAFARLSQVSEDDEKDLEAWMQQQEAAKIQTEMTLMGEGDELVTTLQGGQLDT